MTGWIGTLTWPHPPLHSTMAVRSEFVLMRSHRCLCPYFLCLMMPLCSWLFMPWSLYGLLSFYRCNPGLQPELQFIQVQILSSTMACFAKVRAALFTIRHTQKNDGEDAFDGRMTNRLLQSTISAGTFVWSACQCNNSAFNLTANNLLGVSTPHPVVLQITAHCSYVP